MSDIFKVMLAHTIEDLGEVSFPMMLSPKVDGIRLYVKDAVCYSRSNKPIRSKAVQELFGREELNGLDGEVIYGSPMHKDVFNLSTRACMSTELPEGMSKDNIYFYVFDNTGNDIASVRYEQYKAQARGEKQVVSLFQKLVHSVEEVVAKQTELEEAGWEGAMLKDPNGKYKQGRSTMKQGLLGKLKKFSDSEAVIIGFTEQMHNENVAETNELGRTKRSKNKENLVPANTLGALQVRDIYSGVEFSIGTGFDAALRKEIWDNRDKWTDVIVNYKHFEVGVVDKPRLPVYKGVRDIDDIG